MRKHYSSPSGFLIPRLAVVSALFLAAAFLAWFSFAATPPFDTLSEKNPTLTYTSGPFLQSNPTGTAGEVSCDAITPCDAFGLTVDVPETFEDTHNIVITVSWPNVAEDYDIYLRDGAPPGTDELKAGASSSNPEVIVADAAPGEYTIRIVPFLAAGGTTTTTVELREKPVNPPPPPAGTGTPRYHNFAAPGTMGNSAGEPTLAAGKSIVNQPGLFDQPGGRTMYIAGLETLRVTWNDCSSPASAPGFPAAPEMSIPLWEDKSFASTSAVTLDPILFGDLETGRIQVSQLGPKTSFLAYTDNDGGEDANTANDYTPTQGSPINPGVDHQTIGGGPYSPTLEPPHPLHPNAVYYASQDIAVAQLGRSDTGGLTYGPAVPMYNLTQCGGLHGHIKVTPRSPLTEANGHVGTVYVPNKGCGGQQAVVVSGDNGTTFAIRQVPGSVGGPSDPSVGIDKGGKIYVAMADGTGRAMVSVSADKGVTWQTFNPTNGPTDVGAPFGIKNTVFPTAVGGDADRATVMFLATDTSGNYQAAGVFTGVWHIYAAHTFNGGATWTTVRVTPENDPVQRGSICTGGTTCGADRNLLDFNDIEIDQQGRVIIAYADGCVGCTSPTGDDSRSAKATIARQSGGKRMLAAFDPLDAEPNPPANPLVTSVTQDEAGVVHLQWAEPDNGGAPLTGYNVYRKEGTGGTYVRLGSNPTVPANRTSYDDTTATNEKAEYFYKVTATNLAVAIAGTGESGNCGDFPIGEAGPIETPCALPGLTILTDATGDALTNVGGMGIQQHDVQFFSLAETFGLGGEKLVFTLKMANLNAPLPPNTHWPVEFDGPDAVRYVAQMSTFPPGTPAAPVFQVGLATALPATLPLADPASSYNVDGTIRIVVPRSSIGNPAIGQNLTGFLTRIAAEAVAVSFTPDNMPDTPAPTGSYTIVGNNSCAPNSAPLAVLAASPISGTAPLVVNFTAAGSTDPDGDVIKSYTFNFGDGSTPLVKTCSSDPACATAQYTYVDSGLYTASVRVTDIRDATSTNPATELINVGTTLTGVVSRKVHSPTATGPEHNINLPTSGPVGVECRNKGDNSHTIVFTFQRNLIQPAPASTVTEGTATKGTEGIGPFSNQYFVNIQNVTNRQYVTVTLDGVRDTAGANLTRVRGRMAVLNGDTTANQTVNSSDIGQAKAQSGQSTTGVNFRLDVNANGTINSSDISQIKSQSGTILP